MEPDGITMILGVCLFVLIALMVIVRHFRLPPDHAAQQLKRDELRRMLVKQRILPPEPTAAEAMLEALSNDKKSSSGELGKH